MEGSVDVFATALKAGSMDCTSSIPIGRSLLTIVILLQQDEITLVGVFKTENMIFFKSNQTARLNVEIDLGQARSKAISAKESLERQVAELKKELADAKVGLQDYLDEVCHNVVCEFATANDLSPLTYVKGQAADEEDMRVTKVAKKEMWKRRKPVVMCLLFSLNAPSV